MQPGISLHEVVQDSVEGIFVGIISQDPSFSNSNRF